MKQTKTQIHNDVLRVANFLRDKNEATEAFYQKVTKTKTWDKKIWNEAVEVFTGEIMNLRKDELIKMLWDEVTQKPVEEHDLNIVAGYCTATAYLISEDPKHPEPVWMEDVIIEIEKELP